MSAVERWWSHRIESDVTVARWGDYGRPVLLFPTAGGDAQEAERMGLVESCSDLLAEGRIKIYSVDSIAGKVMLDKDGSPEHRLWVLNKFHDVIRREVVPLIHADVGGPIGIIAAGASIGAFNSVATMCRYPDVIHAAVAMSGSFTIERFYDRPFTDDLYHAAPVQFLPGVSGEQLELLQRRFAIIATGSGRWENVGDSWTMAESLGAKGVPNRVDDWGPEWDHDWPTWYRMLPQYLDELTG
ncbi:MAG: hypothetical protein H0T85_07920 [Geodermatophilaceae bacterium]|nr:hypothetical protein [Geodermatophilaceae bacterium]